MHAYRHLNEAAKYYTGLASGDVEIWYFKGEPLTFMFEPVAVEVDINALSETHVLLGKIKERDLEKIFAGMQADFWSPNGEARELINSLNLTHTSMSVGDIVVMDGKVHLCVSFGWRELN